MTRALLWVAALAAPTAAAVAAPTGPLQITTAMLAEARHAAADGTTRIDLVAPKRVGPGDRVVVKLSYRNLSDASLSNVTLANPVPRGLLFRAAADGSPAPELSVDGQHFGALGTLSVRGANGALRPATANDITAVRWRLAAPVAPHAAGSLAFRAEIK